jgi:hypothetical protein
MTCSNLKSFPTVPIYGLFHYLVIYKSSVFDYSNLNRWDKLRKISLVQTHYQCDLVKEIKKRKIEFETDIDNCSITREDISTTVDSLMTDSSVFSNLTVAIFSTIKSESTNFPSITTLSALQGKKQKSLNLKFVLGGTLSLLILVLICSLGIIYLIKKKVKVSRLPPNLPSGSQLDMGNPSVSIEMDSFDSFDFQSSNENIYEIPNPIYSNV